VCKFPTALTSTGTGMAYDRVPAIIGVGWPDRLVVGRVRLEFIWIIKIFLRPSRGANYKWL